MGDVTTAATRPRARGDLVVVELDGEAIIYDAGTTQVHRLNSTARIVFSLCDGNATVGELAADLAEAYGLPLQDVEAHMDTLIADLGTAGLLENSLPGGMVASTSLLERPVPPVVEPPTRHLHTKRRGSP